MSWFELNENAILNEKASKGLPDNIGDLVTVVRYRPEFSQYNYEIRLPNGDIAFVKESEINKLTDEQKELITYIFKGNRVIYIPSNEEVTITKCDFINNQVAIKFDDYGAIVVGFEALKKLDGEIDSVGEFKFKVGDKVKIKTEDSWNGFEGVITESYKTYNDIGYDVSFRVEGETTCFNENELELIETTQIKENKSTYEKLLDVFFAHYRNENDTYTLPKQLLINLVKESIELE